MNQEANNYCIPSPSMKASLSAEMLKSPKTFTAETFGSAGTMKCFPGRNALSYEHSKQDTACDDKTQTDLLADLRLITRRQQARHDARVTFWRSGLRAKIRDTP